MLRSMPLRLFKHKKHFSSRRQQQLSTLSLFASLAPREIAIVDQLLHERHYVQNEVIFDENEEAQALYIVLSGKVLICRQGNPSAGKIVDLGAGQFFGDMALLDDFPRSAQARALEDCTLVAFYREDFMSLLETHALIASKISLQLARHLGARLRACLNNRDLE
jgi:CRP-like cAMP-binding protein